MADDFPDLDKMLNGNGDNNTDRSRFQKDRPPSEEGEYLDPLEKAAEAAFGEGENPYEVPDIKR